MAALEQRAIEALRAFGVLMTDTCINYQTIMAPVRGEHLAYGDTGVVIYSQQRARRPQQFRRRALGVGRRADRPHAALRLPSRCLPARHPAVPAHRDAARSQRMGRAGRHRRRGVRLLLGGPGHRGHRHGPRFRRAEAFRHGAGELWLGGAVPHARHHRRRSGLCGDRRRRRVAIGRDEIEAFLARYAAPGDKLDVVVFGAPQLSLFEIEAVARALDGRRVHRDTTVIVATSPEIKHAADRMGLTSRIEAVGRGRRAGHLLLPELCPRDGRGQWLDPADDQLGQARQHHRRLRLPADPGQPRALRRLRRRRAGAVMPILLRCHKGIGPAVTGTALVAADNFSARYDLDRAKGVFSRPSHKLAGQSYADRILVLDTAKGGVATAWMLHDMAARGIVPKALIFNRVNPILAQGAAFGGVALVDRFEGDVTRALPHRRRAARRSRRRARRDPEPRRLTSHI